MAKVSCILRHRGVQLILAYSLAKLVILVACKGRGECFYFFCFFPFILFLFLPCPSLSSPLLSLLSLLHFFGRRQDVVNPQHNQKPSQYMLISHIGSRHFIYLFIYLFFFPKKIMLDISCESKQMSHTNCQAIFFFKDSPPDFKLKLGSQILSSLAR